MALEFKLKDFFKPFSLASKYLELRKSQWLTKDELDEYQALKIKSIIKYAIDNVPHYSNTIKYKKIDFNQDASQSLYNFSRNVPSITREEIKNFLSELVSKKFKLDKLSKVSTSGTSGSSLTAYMDASANSLEFAYYLRFWGWHGYQVGDRFADFSSYSFVSGNKGLYSFSKFTNRLILNSTEFTPTRVKDLSVILLKFRPKYLKGAPMTLLSFISLLEKEDLSGLKLSAIFTSGEILTESTRKKLQEFFSCKVFDSYGHMERTFAASECEYQKLHVNSDYGYLELKKLNDSTDLHSIISTGLHNYAMPLIRYEVKDLVEYDSNQDTCDCGREFPVIKRVVGRENDIVKLPRGRVIPAMYLMFDDLPDVSLGQIVQNEIDSIIIRVVPSLAWNNYSEEKIRKIIKGFISTPTNEDLKIRVAVEIVNLEQISNRKNGKFKTVISNL